MLKLRYLFQICNISENQLRLQFKRLLNHSPQQYINQKRIQLAKQLLCQQQLSITDIAFEMNFSSSQYFSLFFKKQTALTPYEFRKSMKILIQSSSPDTVTASEATQQLDTYFHLETSHTNQA